MKEFIIYVILLVGIFLYFAILFAAAWYADKHMPKSKIKELILYHEEEIERHRLDIQRLNRRLESM
jgi:hypothetical protein